MSNVRHLGHISACPLRTGRRTARLRRVWPRATLHSMAGGLLEPDRGQWRAHLRAGAGQLSRTLQHRVCCWHVLVCRLWDHPLPSSASNKRSGQLSGSSIPLRRTSRPSGRATSTATLSGRAVAEQVCLGGIRAGPRSDVPVGIPFCRRLLQLGRRLTIRPSRIRFAGRLNPGVRRWWSKRVDGCSFGGLAGTHAVGSG